MEEIAAQLDMGSRLDKKRLRIEDEDSLPDVEEQDMPDLSELRTFDLAKALMNYKKLLKFLARTRKFEQRLDHMDRILVQLGLAHGEDPLTRNDLKTEMLAINAALDEKFRSYVDSFFEQFRS